MNRFRFNSSTNSNTNGIENTDVMNNNSSSSSSSSSSNSNRNHSRNYNHHHDVFRPYRETVPRDMPSSETTDSIIASQLSKLSFQDRERILEEIHGISQAIVETESFLQEKFLQLQQALQENSTNENRIAYDMAMAQNSDYVTNRTFQLAFLRAERFHPESTAIRLFRHFHFKLEFFGSESLARDITQDDLTDDDLQGLYSGVFQRSCQRDSAGRTLWVSFGDQDHVTMNARSKLRWKFYLLYRLTMDDVEGQKNGTTAIAYQLFPLQLGKRIKTKQSNNTTSKNSIIKEDSNMTDDHNDDDNNNDDNDMDTMETESTTSHSTQVSAASTSLSLASSSVSELKKMYWNVGNLGQGLPLRCHGFHFCYDSIFWTPLIALVTLSCEVFSRLRIRSCKGSHQECLYYLMTFGISNDCIPIRVRYNNSNNNKSTGSASSKTFSSYVGPEIVKDSHVEQMKCLRMWEREQKQKQRMTTEILVDCSTESSSMEITMTTPKKNSRDSAEAASPQMIASNNLASTWPSSSATAALSSSSSSSSSSSPLITLPKPQDVLFGRGKGCNYHVGNIQFRKIVMARMEAYNKASRFQKAYIVEEVAHMVQTTLGGRFLKKEGNKWKAVPVPSSKRQLQFPANTSASYHHQQQQPNSETVVMDSKESGRISKEAAALVEEDEVRQKIASAFRSLRKNQMMRQQKQHSALVLNTTTTTTTTTTHSQHNNNNNAMKAPNVPLNLSETSMTYNSTSNDKHFCSFSGTK